ncbi:hypothetical protein BJF86_06340 [Serinicoccus sp. CNJ-927]|uniref:low temperature requirement protein A n=1 Tax=Serinicoccus sp. CNJ-927 TaxID=1904970 RepID=UPI000968E0CC|nr:hypothetical protein BJF86_06340 [Serinicoccus sp. CNJ-927]
MVDATWFRLDEHRGLLVGEQQPVAVPLPSVVTAVLLAVLIAAGLWWSYFGYLRGGAERRLRGTTDRERSRLARDSYSYLHLPLVAGVVFFALGVHEAVAAPVEPLPLLPAVALAGGVAMFYVATSPTHGATTTSSPPVAWWPQWWLLR